MILWKFQLGFNKHGFRSVKNIIVKSKFNMTMRKKSLKTAKMKNPAYDGIHKITTTPCQPPEVICFICDEIIIGKGVPLLMTYTPYSNTDLPTKIGQLMGDGFMVLVAVTDMLCKRCSSLINQLDKLEYDASNVRTALTEFLKIKYQLGEETELVQGSINGDGLAAQSQSLEDHLYLGSEGDSADDQSYGTRTIGTEQTSDDLKYNFVVSQGIKTENLKIEDNGNVPDVKMGSIGCVESLDVGGDGSLRKKENYVVTEADDSCEYADTVDEGVSAVTIYECDSCSFCTPILDVLLDHLQSHSEQDMYKCSQCCQKFETQMDVEHHIKQVHGTGKEYYNEDIRELENDPDYYPTPQKMYECTICKYHHNNKKIFDIHMRKHAKSEKLACKICSKSFKHTVSLKKHMFRHKMFKCRLCSALFRNKVSLGHHMKINHHSMETNSSTDKMSPFSVVNIARTCNDESVVKETERIAKEGEEENSKELKQSNEKVTSVDFDQVEDLLEKMHSDGVREESFVNTTAKPNCGEQNRRVLLSEDGSDPNPDNEINISLQPPTTSISDVKEYVENSASYLLESQDNGDSFENNENEPTHDCDILAVLDSDCTMFEDSEYTENVSNGELMLNKVNKENGEHTMDIVESKTSNNCVMESNVNKPVSRKVYMCSLCGLKTSSETHIKRHFKCHIALERKTYKCHICERVLTTRSNLKRHISLHERCLSGKIECNMCNEVLTDRLHLKHHMEVKHPESYQCSFCDRRFDSKRACREHELTHPALKCELCQKMFLTEGRLKSHKIFMHSEPGQSASKSKIFECYICHKILTTYHNLKRHLRNHEKCSGVVNCALCDEELTDRLHMRQHVEEKHPENHQCSFCHQVFVNRKSCRTHEMTHPERYVYKCDSCVKVFLNEDRMKRHKDVMHRDPHCRICGKEISNMLKLLDHERRHERHKVMFPCEQCPKVFRTPSGLKYHMSVHTGKYAVYCEICGKGLHSEVVLEEHKATHTKEVRYTCEKCGRTFSSNSTYRMHRLWHDNPLPYKCNICDRKFKHTSILAVHKRRAHTGERPYQCPHCNQTFSVSSTLNKHIILHTKEYPYRCKICEKGFTTRTKIARHMAKVHNDFEMLNSKKKACEYKMVLHPSEISGTTRENVDEVPFISVEEILQDGKVGDEDVEETQAATLQVLEHVTVDPAQAAIFTIFQQDLPSSDFSLNEFDAVAK